MATINVSKPATADQAMEAFQRHFSNYTVYPTKILTRDFIVKKSNWTGVGVKVKQENSGTEFVFTPLIPNFMFQAMFGGLIAYLFLRSSWKAAEQEVADFIQSASEFK